jgi:hypothetical protein
MANAAWAVIGAGAAKIGAAPVAAPDGTLSAYEVAMGTDGGAIGVAGAFYQILGAISAGQVWASSIYVMAKTGASSIRLSYFDGTATTGTVDTPISSTAWTRLVYVVTVNGTSAPNIALRNNVAGNSGNIYVWGGQCELTTPGYPGPTSYIPTTAATVTRAADVAVMTGTNFSSWYNQAAGSFVTQATPPGDYSQLATVLGADVAAVTNVHQLQKSDATGAAVGKRWSAGTITTSVAQALIAQGADGAAITAKLGYAFAANDFAFASGGSIVGTDAAGTVPTVSQLNIGQRDGASQWFNGHIGGIAYYNVRKTNAQLQAMTT